MYILIYSDNKPDFPDDMFHYHIKTFKNFYVLDVGDEYDYWESVVNMIGDIHFAQYSDIISLTKVSKKVAPILADYVKKIKPDFFILYNIRNKLCKFNLSELFLAFGIYDDRFLNTNPRKHFLHAMYCFGVDIMTNGGEELGFALDEKNYIIDEYAQKIIDKWIMAGITYDNIIEDIPTTYAGYDCMDHFIWRVLNPLNN